jgi:hypothetical protein
MSYFKAMKAYRHLTGRTEKQHKQLGMPSLRAGLELNPGPRNCVGQPESHEQRRIVGNSATSNE